MKYYQILDLKDNRKLIEEYKKWHRPENIWKEIPEGIRQVGILEMEIYLFQNHLVMVVETPDDFNWNEQMEKLSQLPLQKEWEVFMDAFQQRLPETTGKWQRMTKIFKLSECI
jgi:L-rhamnose mutarotase